MYCPICKSEFRDGFESCSTCGCSLVEKLPEEEKEEPLNEQEVFLTSVRDEYEADIIESILNSNGIKVLKKHREAGGYISIYMGNSVLGMDIYVLESAYEAAKKLIESEMGVKIEEEYEVPDEEEMIYKQEERITHKRRAIKAWIVILFFSSGFIFFTIYLIIKIMVNIFK